MNIIWNTSKWKESLDSHWSEDGVLEHKPGEVRFKLFCCKKECKIWIQDLKTGEKVEVQSKVAAFREAKRMLKPKKSTVEK